MPQTLLPEETGLEVIDLREDRAFEQRQSHPRSFATQLHGMQRIARTFVERPEGVLQELCEAAIELTGADSAGISIEKEDRTDENYYHWVATAGEYTGFLNATLPRYPSACGVCLDRGKPQHFTVGKKFFDILGVQAELVTDGILLPWQVDATRGTIFVMAHRRTDAFDLEDARVMEVLADFAATGFRQLQQQKQLMEQARLAAAAAMANELAHQINNPLQTVTNLMYLGADAECEWDSGDLVRELNEPVQRLTALVNDLLALPFSRMHQA